MTNIRKMFLLAASVAGLNLTATAVQAQDYHDRGGSYDRYAAYDDGYYNDEVIVVGPRYRERSTNGRPIRTVEASKDVSFYDLDLRTRWGVEKLHSRIKSTARSLCNRLDTMHPVTASDSPPCYRNAVEDAMAQADDAIARARGG